MPCHMEAKVSLLVVSVCSVRAFLRTAQKSFIRKLLDFDSSHLTKHKYKLKRVHHFVSFFTAVDD